jgi:hypothetical protein
VLIQHVAEGERKTTFRSPKTKGAVKRVEPKREKTPNIFWESFLWSEEHYEELAKKYPDKWVAIVDKEVAAAGDSIKDVEEEAENKTGKSRDEIPVVFIEGGIRILCQ